MENGWYAVLWKKGGQSFELMKPIITMSILPSTTQFYPFTTDLREAVRFPNREIAHEECVRFIGRPKRGVKSRECGYYRAMPVPEPASQIEKLMIEGLVGD